MIHVTHPDITHIINLFPLGWVEPDLTCLKLYGCLCCSWSMLKVALVCYWCFFIVLIVFVPLDIFVSNYVWSCTIISSSNTKLLYYYSLISGLKLNRYVVELAVWISSTLDMILLKLVHEGVQKFLILLKLLFLRFKIWLSPLPSRNKIWWFLVCYSSVTKKKWLQNRPYLMLIFCCCCSQTIEGQQASICRI